jgi:hypothetical protein
MSAASDCIRLRIDNLVVFEMVALTDLPAKSRYERITPKNVQCQLQIYGHDKVCRTGAMCLGNAGPLL